MNLEKVKHTINTNRFETKTMTSIGMEMILVILLQGERVKTAAKVSEQPGED